MNSIVERYFDEASESCREFSIEKNKEFDQPLTDSNNKSNDINTSFIQQLIDHNIIINSDYTPMCFSHNECSKEMLDEIRKKKTDCSGKIQKIRSTFTQEKRKILTLFSVFPNNSDIQNRILESYGIIKDHKLVHVTKEDIGEKYNNLKS